MMSSFESPHPPYSNGDSDQSVIIGIIIVFIIIVLMLAGCTNNHRTLTVPQYSEAYDMDSRGYYIMTDTCIIGHKLNGVRISYTDTQPLYNMYGVVVGEVRQLNFTNVTNIMDIRGDTIYVDTLWCKVLNYDYNTTTKDN